MQLHRAGDDLSAVPPRDVGSHRQVEVVGLVDADGPKPSTDRSSIRLRRLVTRVRPMEVEEDRRRGPDTHAEGTPAESIHGYLIEHGNDGA